MDRIMCVVVFGVVAAVMLQCAVAQTTHVVGDSIGWVVPQNGAQAYIAWASSKSFVVGDTLTFNFVTNSHDVLQVTKDSFDACTSTNAIGSLITTGPANITLNSTGDHYYICTVGRHCQGGQKLAITVSATSGAAPPSTGTGTPTPPTTPSPTTSTTPDTCAPTPSVAPKADGPMSSPGTDPVPPPPNSSSSAVFSSFFLIISCIIAAFFV